MFYKNILAEKSPLLVRKFHWSFFLTAIFSNLIDFLPDPIVISERSA